MLTIPPSRSKLNSGKNPSVNEPRTASANSASFAFLWQAFPYLFLAALTALFFWRLITPFELSRAWLWEDFIYQNYPYRAFAATSLAMGHFPFWNPYVFGGQPFFADIQTAIIYPFNLVQALFATPESVSPYLVQFIEILHYLLAAIFTYRFLRLCGVELEASLLGAVTFSFSGFMVTHALHMNFVYVFIWLPLVLEFFEKALSGRKFRHVLLCSLFLALSNMGGYPQYSLYIYYTLGLYWLVYELGQKKTRAWTRSSALRRLATLAFVAIAALGLNAFCYLPAAELAEFTPRREMTYQASVEHSLAPHLLLKLINPKFFGIHYPRFNNYWAGGYSHFWETCLFIGILPLILACWALRCFRSNRHVTFAAALAVISLWLALGQYGFLYKLFFYIAPGFDRFRIPGRFSALVSLALALLAAHGWSMLAGSAGKLSSKFYKSGLFYLILALFSIIVLMLLFLNTPVSSALAGGILAKGPLKHASTAACFASLGWFAAAAALIFAVVFLKGKGRIGLGIAASLLVFAELFWFGAPFLRGEASPEKLYPHNMFVERFQKEGEEELFRINARSIENPGIMLLRRNQGSIHRIFLIEGYNPLQLKRRLGEVEKQRRFDLLNVKYKIAVDLERRTAGFVFHPTYLPRAFVVHNWRVLNNDEQILETLNSPDFDHHSEVVLEADPGIDTSEPGLHIESTVEISRYTQNEIVIDVQTGRPGILVLSEWHYPAWKAWIDGEEAPVLRADHALRAVAVRAGRHQVRFAYCSDSVTRGVAASAITALVILAVSLVFHKRGRF